MKAHVSEKKKLEVKNLVELFKKYKTICLGDLTGLPSKQLQDIRHRLKKSLLIRTIKKRLIRLAIKSFKEKDLSNLDIYLNEIMPVVIFSNESPFEIYKNLKKSKVNVAAKPGQIAPYDLVIQAGPTNFSPGPIIGELGQAGIIAAVEGGKVTIKRDAVVAKKGEAIKPKVADILVKMGIEPMEVKLNLVVGYEDGTVYNKEVLDIDEEKLLSDIKLAYNYSVNLAVKSSYICNETIKLLIRKASLECNGLNNKIELRDVKKEVVEKKSDEEVAHEVLQRMQDEEIKRKEKVAWEKKETPPNIHDLVEQKHKKKENTKIKAEDLINN